MGAVPVAFSRALMLGAEKADFHGDTDVVRCAGKVATWIDLFATKCGHRISIWIEGILRQKAFLLSGLRKWFVGRK